MSILQIGIQSRYLQVSPGCRKYISPFLSYEQKQQIQKQKEENQLRYRSILLNQIKEKQKQKQFIKRKQFQQDVKHQKDFYEMIKKYRQRDSKQPVDIYKTERSASHMKEQDIPSYERRLFKRQNDLTLPTLRPSYCSSGKQTFPKISIFDKKGYNVQSDYLKSNSLIEIGSRLRMRNQANSLNYEGQRQECNERKYQKIGFKYCEERDYKYNQLKKQLKQKQRQIYDLLQKSSKFIQSSKNPIRQLKRRLKTQAIYIPQGFSDEEQEQNKMRYRVKTQFGTYKYQEEADGMYNFYKLPSTKRSLISIDRNSQHSRQKSGQPNFLFESYQQDLIKIQDENPQIQGTSQYCPLNKSTNLSHQE